MLGRMNPTAELNPNVANPAIAHFVIFYIVCFWLLGTQKYMDDATISISILIENGINKHSFAAHIPFPPHIH
jgi:hypothetical protein